MKIKDTKYLVILGLLLVGGFVSWNLYFADVSAKDTINIHDFPKTIGEWTSTELPISEEEYAILETKNAFVRRYTNQKTQAEVYLYLVYSQSNRKVAHPPEICYTGAGASILSSVHDEFTLDNGLAIKANRLVIERNSYQQLMFYWFKVGETFTSNYWKQQSLIALKTLTGQKAGSALVRLSADVVNNDQEKASKNIKEFTGIAVPLIMKYLP